MNATTIQDEINEIVYATKELKKVENYYDAWGLSLSIAIMKNDTIALSSKHWIKNYYIEVHDDTDTENKFVFGLWDIVTQTSNTIGRELERCNNDTSYVFIPNLSREQTEKVYKEIISELQSRKIDFDVDEKWELWGWEVNDINCVHIPWIIPITGIIHYREKSSGIFPD